MMKKIDKLFFASFLGLFILTLFAAFFVLVVHFFLLYFDDMIGKGLGLSIYAQLSAYICIGATKQACPLAVLLASMMAFGNLGEHHELTALKSAGVSMLRALWPLFCFVLVLSTCVFFSNSYLVPRAYLDTISLLHDLGKKKPSVAIKEGIFYDDIPGYSIRVSKKLDGQKTLQGIMIYDHTQNHGNVSLTTAASGKMYTNQDETYLIIELSDGYNYTEAEAPLSHNKQNVQTPQLYRSSFKKQKLLLSLASFKLSRTDKAYFQGSCRAKDAQQLTTDITAMKNLVKEAQQSLHTRVSPPFVQDDTQPVTTIPPANLLNQTNIAHLKAYLAHRQQNKTQTEEEHVTSNVPLAPPATYTTTDLTHIYQSALAQTKATQEIITQQIKKMDRLMISIKKHALARYKMMAWAVSCIFVFLIGAPLGALIKKGGLGVPLLIATGLVVWHYFFEMLGEKWANTTTLDAFNGAWLGNWFLIPFGLYFSILAYRDARILDADFYSILWTRVRQGLKKVSSLFKFDRH